MGYIKEPNGRDFIIQSEPLSDEERKRISEFIRRDKAKRASKKRTGKESLARKKSNKI